MSRPETSRSTTNFSELRETAAILVESTGSTITRAVSQSRIKVVRTRPAVRTARQTQSEIQRGAADLAIMIEQWFDRSGRRPFEFQREVWKAMQQGYSGLLHAGTGSGKTLACWFGALMACQRDAPDRSVRKKIRPGLKVLWITPMRALAKDSFKALQQSAQDILPDWQVQTRTGDTSASVRARQTRTLPDALVTTPESLTLMLAQSDAPDRLSGVQVVIVDEWHELLASKRGVQVQLALARLAQFNASLQVWGMSATLANLEHALDVLLPQDVAEAGDDPIASEFSGLRKNVRLISAPTRKTPTVNILLPAELPRYTWSGQIGMEMAQSVSRHIETAQTTLVFVNTRSQCERWYQALLEAAPHLAGQIVLHHGSLDASVRDWVEEGIRTGLLRAVVCTSSLDLGVDFVAVEQVIQIGSCKGIARLLQRAGRSGHNPNGQSSITLVPTHTLEALEAVAACDAMDSGSIEPRCGLNAPMDVLVQHLVTVALGGGFEPDALYQEVRRAYAYRHLTPEDWQWALSFVSTGGNALGAYPDYQRVVCATPQSLPTDVSSAAGAPIHSAACSQDRLPAEQPRWRVLDRRLALRHRMNIGTIVSDAMMQVRYWAKRGGGATLGHIEEGFIARLKPGECFVFGGRVLELVRVQDMTAYVRRATASRAAVPRWEGGNMPLSGELADAMAQRLDGFERAQQMPPSGQTLPHAPVARLHNVESAWRMLEPLLLTQQELCGIASHKRLLVEHLQSREGTHIFMYPLAGRSVHQALASLVAWRLAQQEPLTFSMSVNDYGIELVCAQPLDAHARICADLFTLDDLDRDLSGSVNATEMAQRRFREIARISGLVFQGFPHQKKSARQVQASSQLFYKVFQSHDPGNLLLRQAHDEVLQLDLDRAGLERVLQRIGRGPIQVCSVEHASPFGFGLMVQRMGQRLSSERLSDRIARMLCDIEKAVA